MTRKTVLWLCILGISLCTGTLFDTLYRDDDGLLRVPKAELDSAPYPEWAHHHWVWLSNDQESQSAEIDFVDGFLERDIPVGAVDIDSMWSTGINNFVWNTAKFPNATDMVNYFHSKGIKVILWVTSMVDTDSPNYQEGLDNNYYMDNGRTIKWWHGYGSFIDYTYPEAMDWWHMQMDYVLDIGIDGWKCDGTDPYVFELGGVVHGQNGWLSESEYAAAYYRDFFYYSRTKNPESLIMARPVDSWEFIYLSYAPNDVMFSGWVGDQDPDFDGMQNALRNMFHSAWRNYLNFGSDTAGYRSGDRTKELFIRWSQLSAFCPLFENGGNNDHRPWSYDTDNNFNQTLNIYRNFVNIHYELIPFWLSAGTECYAKNISVMDPQAEDTLLPGHSWDYILDGDILVGPIVENSTKRKIDFPRGNNWIDWWDGSMYRGGNSHTFEVPLEEFPVFTRQGALIPMTVSTDSSMYGTAESKNSYTLVIQGLTEGHHSKNIYEWKGTGMSVEYSFSEHNQMLHFISTPHEHKSVMIVIRSVRLHPTADVANKMTGEVMEQIQAKTVPNGNECFKMLNEKDQGWCIRPVSSNSELVDLIIKPSDIGFGNLLTVRGVNSQ